MNSVYFFLSFKEVSGRKPEREDFLVICSNPYQLKKLLPTCSPDLVYFWVPQGESFSKELTASRPCPSPLSKDHEFRAILRAARVLEIRGGRRRPFQSCDGSLAIFFGDSESYQILILPTNVVLKTICSIVDNEIGSLRHVC